MKYTSQNINGIDYLYLYDGGNRMMFKLDNRLTRQTVSIAASLFRKEFS